MLRLLIPATLALGLWMALAPLGASAQRVLPQRGTAEHTDAAAGQAPVGTPIVPKDHKCQTCGAPAVMAVAGDHGPVYYCAKHLPTGVSFAPPGQATPPATAAAPAVPAGGSRVVGFPLGDTGLIRGGTADFGALSDSGVGRNDSGDRRGVSRDRSSRDDRREPRELDRPR